jgi:hypothetical protein
MSTTHALSPNLTKDFKAHRFPQANVKTNAAPDMGEMRRRTIINDENERVLFKMDPLEGEMADAKLLLSDGSVGYIMRDTNGSRITNNERNFMNMNNQMKVNVALNGLVGTEEEIEDQIEPVGWIEQGNEENRSAAVNLIRGGSFTVVYNGEKPARQNAWLRVRVPSRDQANIMKADKASLARGAKGVVPLMYEEYNPLETDFIKAEKLYCVLQLDKKTYNYHKKAKKIAESFLDALADMAIAVTGTGKTKEDLVQQMKALIKKEVDGGGLDDDDDDDPSFVTALNKVNQQLAVYRHDKERMIVCKGQHPASNGNYLSVEAARYSH